MEALGTIKACVATVAFPYNNLLPHSDRSFTCGLNLRAEKLVQGVFLDAVLSRHCFHDLKRVISWISS